MSFFEEFKKFAMRGNVIDLAVGVVIGGAFGKITSSLVDNIIMPPLSLLFGKVDFSGLFISLNGQTALRYFKGCSGCTCPYFSLRSFYKYYR